MSVVICADYRRDQMQSEQAISMIINEFDLDKEEELFDDFKCTLRTSAMIERMGHMYLTEDHLCFCGHIFGETKFKLRFTDIRSIVKTKTLGIFDWAIMSKATVPVKDTDGKPGEPDSYLFGAFQNRDLAFKRMMDLWVTHVPHAVEAQAWQRDQIR